MERNRINTLILVFLVALFVLIPSVTNAEPGEAPPVQQQTTEQSISSDPFLPGDPIDSPFYNQYPPDKFIVDGVPADDDSFSANLYEFTNDCLDKLFYLFMELVEFGIRMINWAFDLDIANNLINILNDVLPILQNSVWEPFWYTVFALGFFGIVLMWGRGQDSNAFTALVGIFSIMAIAPVIFMQWPGLMKSVNEVATYVSSQVLTKMVEAKVEVPEQQQKPRSVVFKDQQQADPEQKWFDSPEVKQYIEIKRSIHAVDDSLWKAFVYEPYLIIEFGDHDLGEKYFDQLMKRGTNVQERRQYLKEIGGINDDGTTQNEQFQIFTADGAKKRIKYVASATMLSLLPLLAMTVFAFVVLYWTCLAIGRAALMVVHFLLALWPSYGFADAVYYLYKTIAALLMKIFYSIVLAVFLRIWIALQDPNKFSGMNFGGRTIMTFILLWAFWKAVVELREKVGQVRGLFGGSTTLDTANELQTVTGKLAGATKQAAVFVATRRQLAQLRNRQQQSKLDAATKATKGWLNSKAKQGLNKVGDRIRLAGAKRGQLNSNLSDKAREAFVAMSQKKLDPMLKQDRELFARMRPEYKTELHELGRWFDRELKYQFDSFPKLESGMVSPPPPPKVGTPEYRVWKQNPQLQKQWELYTQVKRSLYDKAYQTYKKRRAVYDNNFLVRMFKPELKFQNFMPSEFKIMREYRKRLDALKQGNDRKSS